MKESRMIEEMSRFEYWRDIEWRNGRAYGNNAATWSKCVPDYLHDHNAVQRVIDGGTVWVTMVSLPVGLAEVVSGLIHEGRYMDALYLVEQKGRIL